MRTTQENVIYVRLLGKVELENRWGVASDELSQHTLAGMLLKCLLVEPSGEVSLDELMNSGVWPVGQPDEAIIRMRLLRLRKSLEPLHLGGRNGLVLFSAGWYSLNPQYELKTDVGELVEMMKCIKSFPVPDPAGLQLCHKALNLFRGPFMEGTEDASWFMPYRKFYHKQLAQLTENMLERMQALNDYQALEDLCHKAVEILPEEEKLHRTIINLLVKQRHAQEVTRHITQLDRSGRADWINNRIDA